MGGRKKNQKINLDWSTREAYGSSNFSVSARNLRKSDLGGVIFGTTHNTITECLSRQLFGLPEGHFSYIKNIKKGLVLFLFNYSDRKLHGIFEAAGSGQMNIDQYAWVNDADEVGYTRYPAQVKICVKRLCNPLSEEQFQPVLDNNYYSSKLFHFELDHAQTQQLVSLFTSSTISTKWNNFYACLPAPPPRQQTNAFVLPSIPENLNQPSMVSYASVLGGTDTTTTTGSSSQPVGTWSALFKSGQTSEASSSTPLANTTSNELPLHEEYDDKSGFVKTDTWEESQEGTWENTWEGSWEDSQWVATDEVGHDQTWDSDVNTQANMTNDTPYVTEENTWEESQHTDTGIFEAGHVQTSYSSGQHLNKPPLSPEHAEDNPVSSPSSVEETESEDEEDHGQEGSLASNTVVETLMEESEEMGVIEENIEQGGLTKSNIVVESSTDLQPLVAKLMQEVEVMKGSQLKQIVKINRLEQEMEQLRNQVNFLESGSRATVDPTEVDNQIPSNFTETVSDLVLVVGGHDGSFWLPTLDLYFPSRDIKFSLSPMNTIKKYASAATLNGEVYHFGGDTVESFNPATNQWAPRPDLYWKNINVAGASVLDKLFVVGGANGPHCSSEVEYLDVNVGKWLPARSMQSKRLAPAAAELNHVLYVSGGYDGVSSLSSVERLDPREKYWHTMPNMNAKKGCHSMVVLNDKLYTVGGYNGDGFLATLEYLDTRMGAWVEAEPMNVAKGNFGAFVLEGKIYAVGGRKEKDEVLDIVECYKEGSWEVADNLKAIGKRSHFSAIVM